jgi:cold shock CspA family protein
MPPISNTKSPTFKDITGRVNIYVPRYGFGHITPDAGQNIDGHVFFPTSILSLQAFRAMQTGKRVTFDLHRVLKDQRGDYCAVNVTIQKDTYVDREYQAKLVRFDPKHGFGFVKALGEKQLPDIFLLSEIAQTAGYDRKDLKSGLIVTVLRTRVTRMRHAGALMVDRLAPRAKPLDASAPDLNPNL